MNSCCITVDYDGPICPRDRNVKARKEYTCCECGDRIKKGTLHRVYSGLWDEKWETYRFCMTCTRVGHDYFCGGWAFGQLWYDLAEYLGPEILGPDDEDEGEEVG